VAGRGFRYRLIAAAIVVVAGAAGCGSAGRPSSVDPVSPSARVGTAVFPPPVDVVVGQELWTRDGQRRRFDGVNSIAAVYRVPAGWLVSEETADDGGQSLWLLTDDGDHHALLSGAVGLTVAADGWRVAWRTADELRVGRLEGRRIVTVARTDGMDEFWPQVLLDDAVLVARPGGDGPSAYDLWFPAQGQFRPTPRTDLLVSGATPDGHRLVGSVPGEAGPCLALFDPATLATASRACGLGHLPGPHATLSPDGRWLLVPLINDPVTVTGHPVPKLPAGNPTGLVDLTNVFHDPVVVATWPDKPQRDVDLSRCAWSDARTVYCRGGAGLARLSVDRPGLIDWVDIDGAPVVRRGA
jgi:hypothetical protein